MLTPASSTTSPRPGAAASAARIITAPTRPTTGLVPLQILLAVYIVLWVFEGALRKWIVPGLSNPLLIVRDPVLLLIYALALARGVFPKGLLVWWTVVLSMVALALSYTATEIPLSVQLFGWRTDFLHLPLIFVAVNIIDRDSIRLAGKWILIVAVPMGVLVTLQFMSPGGGYLNRGVGGGENGMLESAYGHIRPSGTFSFSNGLAGFICLVAAFVLHHHLERRIYPRWLYLAAIGPLAAMITLSGSRGCVGMVGLIMAMVVVISLVKARYWQPAAKLIIIGVTVFVALGSIAIFRSGMDVFSYRFGDSTNVQKGFFGRAIDSLVEPLDIINTVPAGGVGLGMGTNAGAALMTGKRGFLIAEGEWPRVLMESGAVVGTLYILLRVAIVLTLAAASFRSLWRDANTLPLLIFGGCAPDILSGQFSQPAGLGFATIAGAMCLAACRLPTVAEEASPLPPVSEPQPRQRGIGVQAVGERVVLAPVLPPAPQPEPKPVPALPGAPGRRGRSIYAERMHGGKGEE